MKLVSIVIPAYNEEETIGKVLDEVFSEIKKLKQYKFEVIVVNNNSKDKTAKIAEEKGAKVVMEEKPGKGRALARGFKETKGEIVIMLDADYSHIASEFIRFLNKIEEGYGLVIGSRILGGSEEYTLIRSFGNIFLTKCFRIMFGTYSTDALNGFKAFKNCVVKNHKYKSKDFEIEIELIYNALKEGLKVGEIVSHERERAGGKMKSKACIHGPKFLWAIIKYGLRYRLGI